MNLYERALKLAAKKIIVSSHTDEETAASRYNTCLECPKRIEENNTCGICHCFLDVKTTAETNWNAKKLRNEVTHCPLGKWNDLEIANTYRRMDGKEILTTKTN